MKGRKTESGQTCIHARHRPSCSARPCSEAARKHGMNYPPGGAHAWAEAGTAYLSLVLCGLGQSEVRRLHCHARDLYGSVILDCRWYEELKDSCMGGNESTEALLPGKEGTPCRKTLTAGLFLEMLDFCRESKKKHP